MVYETTTAISPEEVVTRAKKFFGERVPLYAAFPEKEGPGWVLFRGQGGEEIALAAHAGERGTMVRGSTMLFEQQVSRFLSTLPPTTSRV